MQSGDIRTFKRGEWYHLGVQLQDKYGNWSDVIYIGCAYNDKCPELVFSGGNAYYRLPYCKSVDNVSAIIGQINLDDIDDFVAIRPVVSFPTSSERNVVCQGILNPTVFNLQQRIDNTCFAQASWFFRPYPPKNDNMDGSTHDDGVGYDKAAYVQFKHYSPIWSSDKICGEI